MYIFVISASIGLTMFSECQSSAFIARVISRKRANEWNLSRDNAHSREGGSRKKGHRSSRLSNNMYLALSGQFTLYRRISNLSSILHNVLIRFDDRSLPIKCVIQTSRVDR